MWNRREARENIKSINDSIKWNKEKREEFKDHQATSDYYDNYVKAYEKILTHEEEYIQRPWFQQIGPKPFFSDADVDMVVWKASVRRD